MSEYLDMDRRSFFKNTAFTATGMALGMKLLSSAPLHAGVLDETSAKALRANLFVALNSDGTVEITCHRSEMGQHIRTAYAQVIAEELDADWDKVKVIQAKGDNTYGDQNTDGSRSLTTNMLRLRQMGASARAMLIQAAAKKWDVDPSTCSTDNHYVVNAKGKKLAYGKLAKLAAVETPPEAETLKLKPKKTWRYIGKTKPIVDMTDILTGTAIFGADALPDAKVAVIVRPPVVQAKVKSANIGEVKKLPGVLHVINMPVATVPVGFNPLGGIAVVAENTWAAISATRKLNIEWEKSGNDDYDSAVYRNELFEAVRKEGQPTYSAGDVTAAMKSATKTLSAEYYIPHLSQAPMEPPAACAIVTSESAEIWSPTQNPQSDQKEIATLLGFDLKKVKVNVTMLGGGFGRKSKCDFSVEAAYLAKQTGLPIRVQWTRENDIQHGFYEAVNAQKLDAGLDKDGNLLGFRHRSAFPPIASTFVPNANFTLEFEQFLGIDTIPFETENLRSEITAMPAKVRIGWMRSVHNIYHAFAQQSFASELAHAVGADPKDYLLKLIGKDRVINLSQRNPKFEALKGLETTFPYDTKRMKAAVNRVADMAGWGRELPKGNGLGIAVHYSFLSYVATVVEVNVSEAGDLDVVKAWVAIDAGQIVNLDSVKNQIQGGSIYSLSYALHSKITAKNGIIEQSNFHDYQVARMSDSPLDIEVDVIDSDAAPAGVGEPGTPPFAPALCNAIFAASGKRIRELPIGDQLNA